jgi:hypothetical protein
MHGNPFGDFNGITRKCAFATLAQLAWGSKVAHFDIPPPNLVNTVADRMNFAHMLC